MTDIDATVKDIKDRLAAAVRARARHEHDRAAAQAQVRVVLDKLRHEFEVTDAEEARTELEALRTDLDRCLEELSAAVHAIQV